MIGRTEWRRWSERSRVERVDLYTRGTLYALLWGLPLTVMVQAASSVDPPGWFIPTFLALTTVLGTLATSLLRDAVALYPAFRPLPTARLTALTGLSTAVIVTVAVLDLADAAQGALPLLVCFLLLFGTAGLRDRWVTAGVATGALLAAWLATGRLNAVAVVLFLVAFTQFTIRVSLWLLDIVRQLDAARPTQAALAVAEERLRFSRDLHDVLGHRLVAIGVQSELAASLARRGDASAPAHMLEVRAIAHETLREGRALAHGYRAGDFDRELEGARSLLAAAGIDTTLDVESLPGPWRDAASWVVREAVTNVLRHSQATHVSIRHDGSAFEVANDGAAKVARHGTGRGGAGSGLVGLRERLEALGARLDADHDGDRFAVRMVLP